MISPETGIHHRNDYSRSIYRWCWLFTALAVFSPAKGELPCSRCHPRETAGYQATAMAHSSGSPASAPSGQFVHAASRTEFKIEITSAGIVQRLSRDGETSQYSISYA